MKKITVLILLLTFLLLAGTASAIKVEFQPNDYTVDVGEIFEVKLYVTEVSQFYETVATDLITYDPDVLELISVEHGDLFPFWLVWINGTIDNENGELRQICGASNISINHGGHYLTLTFKGLTDGFSYVTLEDLGIAFSGEDIQEGTLTPAEVIVGTGEKPPDDPPDDPPSGGGGGGGFTPPDDDGEEDPDEPVDNETDDTTEPDTNTTEPNDNETINNDDNQNDNTTTDDDTDNITDNDDISDNDDVENKEEGLNYYLIGGVFALIILLIASLIYIKLYHDE